MHHTQMRKISIEGYASIFGVVDMNGDIVERGAFAKSLRRRPVHDVKCLYQHAADQPIGVWRELKEDARGLYARGEILLTIERGRDVAELVRSGALDGLSIGFRAIRSKRGSNAARGARRRLLEVDLWEISIVTFPMASDARIARFGFRGSDVVGRNTAPPALSAASDRGDELGRCGATQIFAETVREAANILRV